jgi:alpha-tubulin suppressor-like RCC1 family protein
LSSDGDIYVCGSNRFGELWNGTHECQKFQIIKLDNKNKFTDIEAHSD